LSRLRKESSGITGIETAIILLAFVVVSTVFAYTVLSAGILASGQGKAAIFAGVKAAGGAMEIKGGVTAKSLSFTGENLGTGDGATTLFTSTNTPVATGTETVYLAGVPQTRDTNYTIVNSTGVVTFISSTVVTGESIGAGDAATLIFGPTASAPIVADSQTVYLAGVPRTEGVDYSIVDATGVVTFVVAPGLGIAVTIDYTSVPPVTGVAVTMDYEQGAVNEVMFMVSVPLKDSSIDMTTTTDSNTLG
jgi:flagellin-like protein